MSPFSYSIEVNIRRFQNLLDTSNEEAERQAIQDLLDREKAKAESQAAIPKKR